MNGGVSGDAVKSFEWKCVQGVRCAKPNVGGTAVRSVMNGSVVGPEVG